MGGILQALGAVIGAIITFIQNVLSQKIDSLVTAEYVSLSVFPHYNYRIVCGGGVRSGKAVGYSHLAPSVVYIGADASYYTVSGSGYRDGRPPYIPMVGSATNVALKTWVGTTITSCGGGGTSVAGEQWYTRVKFKCVNIAGAYLPPLSLYDFSMIGAVRQDAVDPNKNTSSLLSAIISSGMLLGPANIWMASSITARVLTQQFTAGRDFDLAMTPAGLQEYMRVE